MTFNKSLNMWKISHALNFFCLTSAKPKNGKYADGLQRYFCLVLYTNTQGIENKKEKLPNEHCIRSLLSSIWVKNLWHSLFTDYMLHLFNQVTYIADS